MKWLIVPIIPIVPIIVVGVALAGSAAAARSQGPSPDLQRKAFDEILDVNVRDGFVYYRALQAERGQV